MDNSPLLAVCVAGSHQMLQRTTTTPQDKDEHPILMHAQSLGQVLLTAAAAAPLSFVRSFLSVDSPRLPSLAIGDHHSVIEEAKRTKIEYIHIRKKRCLFSMRNLFYRLFALLANFCTQALSSSHTLLHDHQAVTAIVHIPINPPSHTPLQF